MSKLQTEKLCSNPECSKQISSFNSYCYSCASLFCANIGCNAKLGFFELKHRRRFCTYCKTFVSVLRWRCKSCSAILDSVICRETRLLCNDCQSLPKLRTQNFRKTGKYTIE